MVLIGELVKALNLYIFAGVAYHSNMNNPLLSTSSIDLRVIYLDLFVLGRFNS